MDPAIDQLDDKLAGMALVLRDGDRRLARQVLAALASTLDHYIRREESLDWPVPRTLEMIRTEHASLKRLVTGVAIALDQSDDRRALELIGKLRSVLVLHLVKEELISRSRSRALPSHPARS